MKNNLSPIILAGLCLCLTGCAVLLEGGLLEGAVLRGAVARMTAGELALTRAATIELSGGRLLVGNSRAFATTLERVTVERSLVGRPRLSAKETGAFAEVVDARTIRTLRDGLNYTLPGELYAVRGHRVNVRAGPGVEYSVLKQLNSDQLVLVRSIEKSGWCKVEFLEDQFGFMSAAYLTALAGSSNQENSAGQEKSERAPIPRCEERKTGSFCFHNKTGSRIKVGVNFSKGDAGSMDLWPGQSDCFKDRRVGVYHYVIAVIDVTDARYWHQEEPKEFRIDQCVQGEHVFQ